MAQPTATARAGSIRRASSCATAEAANSDATIAPATAWLVMPMTPDTNDGATAVNRPITAKPANAAVAAMTNTDRVCGGIDNRCRPMPPLRCEVSAASSMAATASTTSTMCSAKARCRGCGAYCTRSPASSGPRPRPPMLATVATAAARVRHDSRRGLDHRRGGRAGEDARRQSGQKPTDQQFGHRVGDQEDRGAEPVRTPRRPAAPAGARRRRSSGRTPAGRTAPRRRRWRR